MATKTGAKPGLWGRLWSAIVLIQRILIFLLLLIPIAWVGFVWWSVPEQTIDNGVALVWAPQGVVLERSNYNPAEIISQQLLGEAPHYSLMRNLLDSLRLAASDDRIKALYLDVSGLDYAGMAQLQELGRAIAAFKHTGKPVYAYAGNYSQAQFYLAAQAEHVYLDPLGAVWMPGMSLYQNYFKDALDKLGVKVHVFRAGIYKSAVEPFTRNSMSPEAKAANQAWLNTQWSAYVQTVAAARALPAQAIQSYANQLLPNVADALGDAATLAHKSGLVDALKTRETVRDELVKIVGRDAEHGSFRQINSRAYLSVRRSELQGKNAANQVGLLVVQGPIVDGNTSRGTTGSDTLSWQIHEARLNTDIDALVLRINSPGGSVTAAEAIRRELELYAKAGKPLVVSMSSLAASGGYWIATAGDQIYADGATLTGSIGVFGLMPTFEAPLNKLGIHSDGVGTTANAGLLRLDRALDPRVAAATQARVDYYYRQFTGLVAAARKLSIESTQALAQGRVWSGNDAQRLGLVDQIGGLREAELAAAKLAGFQPDNFRMVPLGAQPGWRSALADLLSVRVQGLLHSFAASLNPQHWWDAARQQLGLAWLDDPQDVYAWCGCALQPVPQR